MFDAEDIRKGVKLEVRRGANERYQNIIDFGPNGCVATEYYEEAMRRDEQMKEDTLAAGGRRNGLRLEHTCLLTTWRKKNTHNESNQVLRGGAYETSVVHRSQTSAQQSIWSL